jgi:hypothetical protein
MPPRDVWQMSVIEYDWAYRGYLESRGITQQPPQMTRSRLEELKALYPDT